MSTKSFARWAFLTDKRRWKSMGATVNSVLEATYSQPNRPATFTIAAASGGSSSKYAIDFGQMTQKNLKTGFRRKIQRTMVLPPALRITAGSNYNPNPTSSTSNNKLKKRSRIRQPKMLKQPTKPPRVVGPPPAMVFSVRKNTWYRMSPSMIKKKQAVEARRAKRLQEAREAAEQCYAKVTKELSTLDADEKIRVLSRLLPQISVVYRSSKNKSAVDVSLKKEVDKLVPLRSIRGHGKTQRYELARNLLKSLVGGKPEWSPIKK